MDSGFAPSARPGMTAVEYGQRRGLISDSIFKQPCTHASSAPRNECADRQISLSVFRAMPGSLHASLREAERRNGAGLTGAPWRRRPARPCEGRRAFRRSTVAIYCEATVRDSIGPAGVHPPCSRGHLRPLSPDRALPLKAAPSSGTDDGIAPWDVVNDPRLQAPHLAPSAKRP